MRFELDEHSRIALDAQIRPTWQVRMRHAISELPPVFKLLAWLFILVALGALIAATFWEGNNAGGGYVMLGKGVTEPWIAYIAGFGFTLAYLVFHRFTAEALRAHTLQSAEVLKPMAAALVFGLLSMGGVFANLVDNASANKSISEQQSADRAQIMAEVVALRRQVAAFSAVQMEAMVEADRRSYAAAIAEAIGWGMPDLDPDGACMADLRPRQRQLCNLVNGPDGIVSSILQGEAALTAHAQTQAALGIAELALAAAPEAERAQFWSTASRVMTEAIGNGVDEQKSAETFLAIFMLLISVFTLLGTGLGWDSIFEYLEGDKKGLKSKE
jgi:hypothetical protein